MIDLLQSLSIVVLATYAILLHRRARTAEKQIVRMAEAVADLTDPLRPC